MKKQIFLVALGLSLFAFTDHAVAQKVIAEWDVTKITDFGPSPLPPTSQAKDIAIVGLTRSAGMTTTKVTAVPGWGGKSSYLIPEAGETPWDDRVQEAVTADKYFYFTLKAEEGKTLSLSEIAEHRLRRSQDGPKRFRWQYKVGDGEFTDLADNYVRATTGGMAIPAIKLDKYDDLQNTAELVTFRLVPYNADRTGGVGNIFDCKLQIKGEVK